jgi:predicted PP-loop superfamily ATPase
MATITLALTGGCDSAAASTAIKMAFGTITVILSSYIFGATWDDKNKRG